jgi:adenylosuccinate synthase
VDKNCLVITPFQKEVGKMRELILGNSSCGMGIGETVRDVNLLGDHILKMGDLKDRKTLESKLNFIWRMKLNQSEQLFAKDHSNSMKKYFLQINRMGIVEDVCKEYEKIISSINIVDNYELKGKTIFEGSQGVLLDSQFGFFPFVTKTDCTFNNAKSLYDKSSEIIRIGVLRGYYTRHGKGPFISEDKRLNNLFLQTENNKDNEWQGNFRVGWFDLVASRYALEVAGDIDFLSLTNLDNLKKLDSIKICTAYETDENLSEDSFIFEKYGNKNSILAIKINANLTEEDKVRRTSILMKARPVYREFNNFQGYLKFLESKEGLGVPIGIESYGPTRKDKICKF